MRKAALPKVKQKPRASRAKGAKAARTDAAAAAAAEPRGTKKDAAQAKIKRMYSAGGSDGAGDGGAGVPGGAEGSAAGKPKRRRKRKQAAPKPPAELPRPSKLRLWPAPVAAAAPVTPLAAAGAAGTVGGDGGAAAAEESPAGQSPAGQSPLPPPGTVLGQEDRIGSWVEVHKHPSRGCEKSVSNPCC